mmetsp:Transcript_15600/g.36771  ORF Transcript_15600/g.36771 Transcript_15600/m.36771 type:complete len:310 (-) Transcript_15600:2195-3124(-)
MHEHVRKPFQTEDRQRSLPRVMDVLGVTVEVFDEVVDAQAAVEHSLRVPHQPVEKVLHEVRRVRAQHRNQIRVRLEQPFAAVVVALAVCSDRENVPEHEARDVELPLADSPVEGRRDSPVQFDLCHPRDPLASRRTLRGLLHFREVSVDQRDRDQVGAGVEGARDARGEAQPHRFPRRLDLRGPRVARKLLQAVHQRFAKRLDVLGLDAVLDVQDREVAQAVKELFWALAEGDQRLHSLHEHVALELLGALEEVQHHRRLARQFLEESVANLDVGARGLDVRPALLRQIRVVGLSRVDTVGEPVVDQLP